MSNTMKDLVYGGPGKIELKEISFLLEDTEWKGHRTKNILPIKRKSVFITIP